MAGSGEIRMNLVFGANTSQAKKGMLELQKSMNDLFTRLGQGDVTKGMNEKLNAARQEAVKLQTALNSAMNVNTGKLDLSKFSDSLRSSGTDLAILQRTLSAVGPEGQKAFSSLTQQIVKAELPAKKLNKTMQSFGQTLINTAKWRISTAMLNKLTSAISGAFNYAQNLNKSLNDIRIVTGYSAEKMSEFAEQANKAAQSLSATTQEYVKASLIYFQQGLDDAQVAARTETTLKLAKVAGESAEEVSSYMTAVWNNFDDGSKSLEYYADAIAALGAATASSSEEIATGLQKFSAVAKTVGLSYEYATAALATVTAQTRESAETVGTAFKTIFARLESLSLGETLDDDTSMTKYSQALAAVGVNIKDATGQLKDMDTIIDELGNKWNAINKDQQVALAQTVAGMRQYNNFIALMDNYKTFTVNVDIAEGASGTLQEQADIYAESWRAAKDRVTASLESIYNKLIDDSFFIEMLNNIEKVVGFVDNLIDSFGGLKGVLSLVSSLMLQFAGPKIAQGLQTITFNLRQMTGAAAADANAMKQNALGLEVQNLNKAKNQAGGAWSGSDQAKMDVAFDQITLQEALLKNESNLTDEARKRFEIYQQLLEVMGEMKVEAAQESDEASAELSAANANARKAVEQVVEAEYANGNTPTLSPEEAGQAFTDESNAILDSVGKEDEYMAEFDAAVAELEAGETTWGQFHDRLTELYDKYGEYSETIQKELDEARQQGRHGEKERDKKIERDEDGKVKSIDAEGLGKIKEIQGVSGRQNKIKQEAKETRDTRIKRNAAQAGLVDPEDPGKRTKEGEAYVEAMENAIAAREKQQAADQAYNDTLSDTEGILQTVKISMQSWQTSIVTAAQGVSQLTFAFSSLSSIYDTLSNPDLSAWEKMTMIFSSLGTALPMLIGGFSALNQSQILSNTITAVQTGLLAAKHKLSLSDLAILKATDAAKQKELLTSKLKLTSDQAEIAIQKLKEGASLKEALASARAVAGDVAETVSTTVKTGADTAETAGLWAKVVAYIAAQAAAAPLLVVTLAIVAAIAILVVGIIALIQVFKKMEANSPAGQLKAAEEQAKAMSEALNEAKDRANSLREAFDGYNSVKDKLAECVKGTEEWNEALAENNNKVLELMQQYPELASMVNDKGEKAITRNADGSLEIADWAMEQMQDKADEAVLVAQTGSLAANAKVREKKIAVDKEKIADEAFDENGGKTLKAIQNVAGAGMATAAAFGPIGLGVAAAMGIAGGIYENYATKDRDLIEENLDELAMLSPDEMVDALNKMGVDNAEAWAKSLSENDAMTQLRASIEANTLALKVETDAIKQQVLANNQVVQDSQYTEQIIAATSTEDDEMVAKRIEAEMQKLERWGKDGISKATGVNEAAEEVFKKYAEAAGIENADLVDTTGTDANRKFVYKVWNAEKKEYEEKTVDLESMKMAVASAQVNKDIGLEAEKLAQIYEDKDASEAARLTAASGDVSFMSRTDIAKYANGRADVMEGLNLSAEDLAALGYESEEEFREALLKNVKEAEEKWGKTTSTMAKRTRDTLNNLIVEHADSEGFKKLTDAQLEQYGRALDTMFTNNGKEVSDNFDSLMSDLLEKNEGSADKIVEIAGSIDWTDGRTGIAELSTKLEEAGIYIDENDALWKNFVQSMKESPTSLLKYDFEKIRAEIAEISKLVKGINFGDVISDEDFATLKKYSNEVSKMFMLTADGYRFIGDSAELQNTALETSRKILGESLNDSKEATDTVNKLNKWVGGSQKDYDYLSVTKDKDAVVRRAQSFMNAEDLTDEELAAMGFKGGKEYLQELIDAATSTDPAVRDDAIGELQKFYGDISIMQKKVKEGTFSTQKDYDLYASQFETLDELEKHYKEYLEEEGLWTEQAEQSYNNQIIYINGLVQERLKELDLYQNEQALIDGLNTKLEKQRELKDSLYGEDKIKALQNELELLSKINEANTSALNIAKQKQAETKNSLASLGSGYNISTDEFGNVLNWEELEARAINVGGKEYEQFKELKDAYNGALSAAENYSEAILDNIEQMSAAIVEMREETNEFISSVKELQDIKVGDVISQDAYKRLVATNKEMAKLIDQVYIFNGKDYVQTREFTDKEKEQFREQAYQSALDDQARTETLNSVIASADRAWGVKDGVLGFNWEEMASGRGEQSHANYSYAAIKHLNEGKWFNDSQLEAMGISRDDIAYAYENYNTDDSYARAIFSKVAAIVKSGEQDTDESLEAYVSQFGFSLGELEAMVNRGEISRDSDIYKGQKQYLEKQFKDFQDEVDILYTYEDSLGEINKQLDENSRLKDKAFGADKLIYIQREIQLNRDLIAQNEAAAKTAEDKANYYKTQLATEYGAIFDTYGNIINYSTVLENAMKAGGEEAVSTVNDLISNYDSFSDSAENYKAAGVDASDAVTQGLIEAATAAAEFNQEIRDLELDWLESQMSGLEDAAFSGAQSLALLGQSLHLYKKTAEESLASLDNLAKNFDVAPQGENESLGDYIARIIEKAPEAAGAVKNIGATLLQSLQDYQAADQALADSLLKHFEDLEYRYDSALEKFQHLSSITSNYKNIIDLVGKKTLGIDDSMLKKINATEQQMANSSLIVSKQKYETLKEDRAKAEKELATAIEKGDEASQAKWQKTLDDIQKKEQAALEEMNDNWHSALEVAASILEEETERIMESFAESMTGLFGSFDRMSEVFSQQSELNSQYVADYKKVYELSKLTRNIQKDIDNTDNIAAKRSLMELQQEITDLQASGAELSEYDLEYLQKRYDLRVAEIALEEAQNAKNQVRLQRTADGSWGYVYTQNSDAVDKAAQNYEDKMYALQELSSNYLDKTSEQIISTQAEFQEAINKIMSSGLSDEEKRKQIEETVAFYQSRLQFLTGEFNSVIENNQGMENMVQSFSDTLLGTMYPSHINSADDIFTMFKNNVGSWDKPDSTLGQLGTALTNFKNSTEEIFDLAGTSIEDFPNKVDTELNEAKEKAEAAVNDISTFTSKHESLTAFEQLLKQIQGYKSQLNDEYAEMKRLYGEFLDGMSSYKIPETPTLPEDKSETPTLPEDKSEAAPEGKIKYADGKYYSEDELYNYGRMSYNEIINKLVEWRKIGEEKDKFKDELSSGDPSRIEAAVTALQYRWSTAIRQGYPATFDTGGYTGSWGMEGRIAMLHQKELVLNAADTENMLAAVNILREVVRQIDLQAANSALIASLKAPYTSTSQEVLQQEVNIHAEFPNATNHSEIEEAFNSLITRAAQYASRNR